MLKALNRKTANITTSYPERIVQFGGGNFLRAFVDWTIQELNDKADFNSGIVTVKVTANGTYEELDAQDGLFHVHLQGIQRGEMLNQTSLISCVNRSVYPYQDFDSYLALAIQPEIRFLISNTTEAGIRYVEGDKLDDNPPSSFPAKLTVFLHHRYQHFQGDAQKGCVILPTELIDNNGTQLKSIVLRYAELWGLDSGFIDWIEAHNLFCNTLVDRIVPGYPSAQADELLAQIGYDDKLLVAGEPYLSWIIEAPQSLKNDFPVEGLIQGAKIVDDANPYRVTKVRILNGAHSSMVPTGILLGLEFVRESIEHEALGQLIQDLIYQEVIPSMDLPEAELKQFAADVFDRFRNPTIHHRLMNIALNSSTKMRTRILPSLLGYVEKTGQVPERLTLAIAAFIRMYKGEWQGETITLKDDAAILAWFDEQWKNCASTSDLMTAVLSNEALWGQDLSQISSLLERLVDYVDTIDAEGILPIIDKLNG